MKWDREEIRRHSNHGRRNIKCKVKSQKSRCEQTSAFSGLLAQTEPGNPRAQAYEKCACDAKRYAGRNSPQRVDKRVQRRLVEPDVSIENLAPQNFSRGSHGIGFLDPEEVYVGKPGGRKS
jgi:hypothetical protein